MALSPVHTASFGDTHPRMGGSSRLGLVLWIGLCVGGGSLIGILTAGGDSPWYQALAKPSWNPPSAVFAPVWTSLYVLMGVAAWRVWRDGRWARHAGALNVFIAQLAANFLWSILFFNLQSPRSALMDITLLWVLLSLTTIAFVRVDRTAGWLLVPYGAWVTFALTLNAAIVTLN